MKAFQNASTETIITGCEQQVISTETIIKRMDSGSWIDGPGGLKPQM